jgi:hypothetical protein
MVEALDAAACLPLRERRSNERLGSHHAGRHRTQELSPRNHRFLRSGNLRVNDSTTTHRAGRAEII